MDAEYEATKRRKQLNLAEALADVQAAAAPSAERTAEMLNSLGTALKRERLGINRPQQVVDAVAKLTGLLLEGSSSSSSSSSSSGGGRRIEQLGGKQLAQSAWALSQVKSARGTGVMQLGLAIAAASSLTISASYQLKRAKAHNAFDTSCGTTLLLFARLAKAGAAP